jgi:hypothetical protein
VNGRRWELRVQQTWDGDEVGEDEAVLVTLEHAASTLRVRVAAPFHDDPPPDSDDLWRFEVVELMLVGQSDRYVEIELSPHGLSLVLFLRGERNIVGRAAAVDYHAQIHKGHWQGVAAVPLAWLPPEMSRVNAFAVHGATEPRRYLVWRPTGGPQPDFHRLAQFGELDECRVGVV